MEDKKKFNEVINKALENAGRIPVGEDKEGNKITYLDSMLAQRVEGPSNAGSSYDMTKEEILKAIQESEWEKVEHPGVMPGCDCYKTKLAGLEGILDIENLPEDTEFYAMDPKGTGKISIGASNVEKREAEETYIVIGEEEIDGKKESVVFTFHPGEPVRPSIVEVTDIPDGTKLTAAQAKEMGMDLAKYMSPEMTIEYREKSEKLILEKEKDTPETENYSVEYLKGVVKSKLKNREDQEIEKE